MYRYVAEDCGKSADLQRIMRRDRHVVLFYSVSGQSNMASRLTNNSVANPVQRFCQIEARKIARQPHAAIT